MAHPQAVKTHQERARDLISRTGNDAMEDAKTMRSAIAQHEAHDHPGMAKTKLKFASGGAIPGEEATSNLAKRARGGPANKKGTHVNVIVAPQGGSPGGGMAPAMPPQQMGPPPGAMVPPPGMVGPPGGPPPGMGAMKRGGGIQKVVEAGVPAGSLLQSKRGGWVKRDVGGPTGMPDQSPDGMAMQKRGGMVKKRADGGSTDDDLAMNRTLTMETQRLPRARHYDDRPIDTLDDSPVMRKKAKGGPVEMEAGAGGGEGRIDKMREYGTGGFKPKDRMPKMPGRAA